MSTFSLAGARVVVFGLVCMVSVGAGLAAQTQPAGPSAATTDRVTAPGMTPPSDYVIGPEDVLGLVFWRDQDMTGDVTVRPDGVITLPLLGDIRAAGLTPEILREQIQKAASRLIADPNVTVVVRQINSRKAYITGQVARPGGYPLLTSMTVMQLIALAGGLSEFADAQDISILRTDQGRTSSFKFNYKDVAKGAKLSQNIQLQPGDTVVVP